MLSPFQINSVEFSLLLQNNSVGRSKNKVMNTAAYIKITTRKCHFMKENNQ